MKTIPYFLILSIFFLLACSLTTPPAAEDMLAQSPKKNLTTPTKDPEPIPHTISAACTVSAESLHLRECAGLHCLVIAWLSKGDVLEIQETDQEWFKVTTPAGQIGWVHSKYCGGSK